MMISLHVQLMHSPQVLSCDVELYQASYLINHVSELNLCYVGRLSVEGKIVGKFEMKPHKEYIQDYSKLCRERTNKYMTRTRQIQVIVAFFSLVTLFIIQYAAVQILCLCATVTFVFFFYLYSIFSPMHLMQVIANDNGLCMRPMPGTFDVKSSGSTVL